MLVRKLEHFTRLSSEDKRVLKRASEGKIRRFGARVDVIREGEAPEHVNLILSGWACRYKYLEDGRRQIMSYFVPGDTCDLGVFLLRSMDHSIGTLTAVTMAEVSREAVLEMTGNHSRVSNALWWSTLVAEAVQREWVVNIGQRTAFERIGHLLCEIFIRLRCVGLTTDTSCEFPITQAELGEATGLSTVHVNRTLQELRGSNLIVLRDKVLTIPDLTALQRASMFSANYLHLDREGAHFDANDL